MLVTGGLEVSDPPAVCYRMLVDGGESLVSRKVHRLLRVPPTGSSASGDSISPAAMSLPPHVVVGEGVRGAGEAVGGKSLHGLLGEPEVFP